MLFVLEIAKTKPIFCSESIYFAQSKTTIESAGILEFM